jgi:hypothetical protein
MDYIDDSWEENKEDIKQDVEDFPENAAHWTGEKVCSTLFPFLPFYSSKILVRVLLTHVSRSVKQKPAGITPRIASSKAGITLWRRSRTSPRTLQSGLVKRLGLWNGGVTICTMHMNGERMRAGATIGRSEIMYLLLFGFWKRSSYYTILDWVLNWFQTNLGKLHFSAGINRMTDTT